MKTALAGLARCAGMNYYEAATSNFPVKRIVTSHCQLCTELCISQVPWILVYASF